MSKLNSVLIITWIACVLACIFTAGTMVEAAYYLSEARGAADEAELQQVSGGQDPISHAASEEQEGVTPQPEFSGIEVSDRSRPEANPSAVTAKQPTAAGPLRSALRQPGRTAILRHRRVWFDPHRAVDWRRFDEDEGRWESVTARSSIQPMAVTRRVSGFACWILVIYHQIVNLLKDAKRPPTDMSFESANALFSDEQGNVPAYVTRYLEIVMSGELSSELDTLFAEHPDELENLERSANLQDEAWGRGAEHSWNIGGVDEESEEESPSALTRTSALTEEEYLRLIQQQEEQEWRIEHLLEIAEEPEGLPPPLPPLEVEE